MSCSMGFGELNIPSSRAFWDDFDEDEPLEQKAEKLQLKFETNQTETPISSNVFLIVEGLSISTFATKVLVNDNIKKICTFPPTNKTSALYYNEKQKTLLAIIDEDLTNSGEVTELLIPYAEKAQRILTVTIKPKVDYKTENINAVRDKITFLRNIHDTELKNIQKLETPNFIVGVAAGIATWRECKNLTINSYVAYTDNIALDALAAKPILKLLQELNIDCSTSYSSKPKDDTNLYT